MEFYAIRDKRTGRWVYGTDHRYHPLRQLTSDNRFIVYPTLEDAKQDFEFRRCGKAYQICKLWAEVDSVCSDWEEWILCETD